MKLVLTVMHKYSVYFPTARTLFHVALFCLMQETKELERLRLENIQVRLVLHVFHFRAFLSISVEREFHAVNLQKIMTHRAFVEKIQQTK